MVISPSIRKAIGSKYGGPIGFFVARLAKLVRKKTKKHKTSQLQDKIAPGHAIPLNDLNIPIGSLDRVDE